MTHTELDHAVLEAIARARVELAEFVCETVRAPSVNGREGCAAPLYARWLERNDFEAETVCVDPSLRDRHPRLAGEERLEERPNVYGCWRSARASALPLAINGHLDVVPPGNEDSWRHPPFAGIRDSGTLHGRGTVDMKGPLAAGMFAVRGLRDAGVELPFDVRVQCVMGEESGGLGTIAALETGELPGAVVVLEPTELVVAAAAGGLLQFSISVEGRAVHTAVPWRGVDALDKLLLVYEGLREFAQERERRLSHPLFEALPMQLPFAAGKLRAGEWRGTVPGHAVAEGRIGLLPGESIADVRTAAERAVAATATGDEWLSAHPPELRWLHEGLSGWETHVDDPLVRALLGGSEALAGQATVGAVTYGSDASHFAERGVPTVLFGPGSIADAHLVDESIDEAELVRAAQILALGVLRYGNAVAAAPSG